MWSINYAIFNDLEPPQTQISRSRHYLTSNVSETVRDTDMVTMKYVRATRECHFE